MRPGGRPDGMTDLCYQSRTSSDRDDRSEIDFSTEHSIWAMLQAAAKSQGLLGKSLV